VTPEQISNLKEGDRLTGRAYRKAEVVERTLHGVVILWENGDEIHYGLEDAALKNLTCRGPRNLEEPWLRIGRVRFTWKRPIGRGSGSRSGKREGDRRSNRGGGR
jgi:hypothetical protein